MNYRYTVEDIRILNDELDQLRAEIERLRAALQQVLNSPQGCDCLPSSGCNRAQIFELVRRTLEPAPGRKTG